MKNGDCSRFSFAIFIRGFATPSVSASFKTRRAELQRYPHGAASCSCATPPPWRDGGATHYVRSPSIAVVDAFRLQ